MCCMITVHILNSEIGTVPERRTESNEDTSQHLAETEVLQDILVLLYQKFNITEYGSGTKLTSPGALIVK